MCIHHDTYYTTNIGGTLTSGYFRLNSIPVARIIGFTMAVTASVWKDAFAGATAAGRET